jgi:poly-gamma-glutamate synthesis protein (capsule biosynthesis protein)
MPAGWHPIFTRPGFTGRGSVDLRAVGDIMLARGVEPVARAHPAGWLLAQVADLLRGDVVVGNLESPFTARRRAEQLRPGPYRLPADPELGTRLAPFTALSLANNHALDAGPEGLAEARRTLHELKINALGVTGGDCHGENGVVTGTALPIRLLAFNAVHDPRDRPDEARACGRIWLDQAALETVARLRTSGPLRPIVVLVHWGDEYAPAPNAEQRRWARELVAAGADLIVGAHPHVVQPAEEIEAGGRRGFVAYSLGNFVFDRPDKYETSHSLVLRAWLDGEGVGAVAVAPIAITNGHPAPLLLQDPAGQAQLAAVAVQPPTGPTPGPQTSEDRTPAAARYAWRWNGTTFAPISVPPGTMIPPAPQSLSTDLRGDENPPRTTLKDGLAQVWEGEREVWRNEAANWRVAGMAGGDADNDGRQEILLRLWKPDPTGKLRSHPFLLGWRGGHYRVFWGGSAVALAIQAAAIGRVAGNRNALVVLEGGQAPGDAAEYVGVWSWQNWTFAEQWRGARGAYRRLALLDLDGDGVMEIVAT